MESSDTNKQDETGTKNATLRQSKQEPKKGKPRDIVGDGGVIKEAILKPPTSAKETDRVGYGAEVTGTKIETHSFNYSFKKKQSISLSRNLFLLTSHSFTIHCM
jgi:hypothetical protein